MSGRAVTEAALLVLGGLVRLPHYDGRNGTFSSSNYEAPRQGGPETLVVTALRDAGG